MAQIKVRDIEGNAIPGINIRISEGDKSTDEAIFDVFTDGAGNTGWPIPHWPAPSTMPSGHYSLHVNDRNVNVKFQPRRVTKSHDNDATIVLQKTPVEDLPGEYGLLGINGRDFVTQDGRPWQFRGYTVHYLQNAFVGGFDTARAADVIDQALEYGYNTLITIGHHNSPWKRDHGWAYGPHTDPHYFTNLGKLFDLAEDRRARVAHAPLADMQYFTGDKQAYWRESCAVMRGRWNVLPRKGNEDKHNGWRPQDYHFPDMGGLLLSHGSRGAEVNPFFPYLDWVEFEVKRKLPKMFLDLPLRQMMDGDFQGPATNRPTVNIEPMYFADTNPDHVGDHRSTDPRVALESGAAMYACAGGAFGCSLGLECRILPAGSISDACAREFIRGLKAGFVRPFAGLDFQGQR